MIIDSIILGIFIVSFAGALFILARKIPALNALPHHGTTGIKKHRMVLDVENKVKDIFVSFEKQIFLHKALSWVKVMILKMEVKVDHLLHGIRKKSQQIDRDKKKK